MIEKRKKEIAIDWRDRILGSNILIIELTKEAITQIKETRAGHVLGIQDEIYYENLLLAEIQNPELESFDFLYSEISKVEVCCSSIFTYETSAEIALIKLNNKKQYREPLTEIYFHFLPLSNKSVIIIGCLKKNQNKCSTYISNFVKKKESEVLKAINDLLISQVENWVCSPSFYRTNCKSRENEINKLVKISMRNPDKRKLNLNLFDISI